MGQSIPWGTRRLRDVAEAAAVSAPHRVAACDSVVSSAERNGHLTDTAMLRDPARLPPLPFEPLPAKLNEHREEPAPDVEAVLARRDTPKLREDFERRRSVDRIDEGEELIGCH